MMFSNRTARNFFKFMEGENFNRRNTLSILRIKFSPDAEIGKISSFRSDTIYGQPFDSWVIYAGVCQSFDGE